MLVVAFIGSVVSGPSLSLFSKLVADHEITQARECLNRYVLLCLVLGLIPTGILISSTPLLIRVLVRARHHRFYRCRSDWSRAKPASSNDSVLRSWDCRGPYAHRASAKPVNYVRRRSKPSAQGRFELAPLSATRCSWYRVKYNDGIRFLFVLPASFLPAPRCSRRTPRLRSELRRRHGCNEFVFSRS